MKEKTDATVQQSRTEADIAVEDKRAAYAMQLEMLRHQNKVAEIQLQQSKQTAPKITLTGVLGPDGTVGAEHQAGLPETDDADDLQEAQDAELKAKAAKPAAGGHDGS